VVTLNGKPSKTTDVFPNRHMQARHFIQIVQSLALRPLEHLHFEWAARSLHVCKWINANVCN